MMPAVRKTTHFTDGALFSFLSHPLFLVPLLVTSPWSLSPRPVPFPGSASRLCFPVMSPGYVSRLCLARSSFNPDYCSLSASLHISLSAPSPVLSSHSAPSTAPSTVPAPVPFPFLFTSPFTFPFQLRLYLRSIYRSDSRQRHSFFGTKVCIANMHPTITRKTMQRHRVLAAKGRIANRKTIITGKILQRHRLFGSKECVASGGTDILDRMKDGAALRHTLDVLRGPIVQGMMFSPSK